ncbi:MAG: hypothetical protein WC749_02160 [Dehalococcoidia bacterium]
MANVVQIDIDATYEGLTCREMIQVTRGRLGVGPNDTNRYTDANVVQALNLGQNRFAKLTACLIQPAIIVCANGRQNYGLPSGTLKVLSARYYTGNGATEYNELKILQDSKAIQRIDSQYRGTAGDPVYMFPTYRTGNRQMVGVSPIPTSDANVMVNATDYGRVTGITGFTIAGDIAGTHKAGYAASAFLVDSAGRDLVYLGAMVGYPVYNTTQGTWGTITAIGDQDATNDKVTATLSSGSWAVGDAFEILMSNYGVSLDADTGHVLMGTQTGVIADVITGQGTIGLDIARKPITLSVGVDFAGNSLETMICEIPETYHEAVIAYATYWLALGKFAGVAQPQKAAEALAVFNAYVNEYKLSDETLVETDGEIEDRASLEWLS